MSRETKRKLSWALGLGIFFGFGILTFTLAFRSLAPSYELTLIAKDMAYYVEGKSQPNPTLGFPSGERIRLTLINRDKGMLHDWVLPELGLASEKISYGQTTILQFKLSEPGWFDYLCSLHPAMMRGKVASTK